MDEGEESSPDAVNVCQASSSLVVHPNPAWCNGSISAFDSEDSRSNRDAGTTRQLGVGQWLASWPGTRTMGVRFSPPRQKGERTGVQRCLASNAGGVQLSGSPPWAVIWDQAGLQNRPAGFKSSTARHGRVAKWEGAGLQPRHRDGSIPSSASARTVVRAVRTRSSKPERRVRLSHGAQLTGGLGARSFSVVGARKGWSERRDRARARQALVAMRRSCKPRSSVRFRGWALLRGRRSGNADAC